MTKDIYVYIEQRNGVIQDVSRELLGEAAKLVKAMPYANFEVVGVLLGHNIADQAASLFGYGANKVIVCDDPALANYSTQYYSDVLTAITKEYQPDSMLLGASVLGRDLAPRVAARLDTGLTADATSIAVDTEEENSTLLLVTRPAFGGNLFGTIICPNTRPQMATIRPKVFEIPVFDEAAVGEVIFYPFTSQEEQLIKVLKSVEFTSKELDVADASIIVSAGRGAKDCLDLLAELAKELGAALGSSRALVEEGITKKSMQVGQTGKTVRPMIYIACGISGAVQHLAGMDKSDYIIAINIDPSAAIFSVANIGLVGDVKKVVPALLEKIRAAKQST